MVQHSTWKGPSEFPGSLWFVLKFAPILQNHKGKYKQIKLKLARTFFLSHKEIILLFTCFTYFFQLKRDNLTVVCNQNKQQIDGHPLLIQWAVFLQVSSNVGEYVLSAQWILAIHYQTKHIYDIVIDFILFELTVHTKPGQLNFAYNLAQTFVYFNFRHLYDIINDKIHVFTF